MGHVFVVPGDVRRLACDGWLLPTSKNFVLSPIWRNDPAVVETVRRAKTDHGQMSDTERVLHLPQREGADLWLVDVGLFEEDMDWVHQGVCEFLHRAGDSLAMTSSPLGRARPLVAMPVVGSGNAAADPKKRSVALLSLLRLLRDETPPHLDVALVTHTDWGMFSAAQKQRSELGLQWPELPDRLKGTMDRLAAVAREGQLVLFVGAGVSAGAGLPTWDGLLDRLAAEIGLTSDEAVEMEDLSLLDRAEIIAGRVRAKEGDLGAMIADVFRATNYSLAHALLASLPVQEVITTNYDTLFESAAAAVGRPLRVLPEDPRGDEVRWLLKLHGSVNKPDTIVLTREDYLRYSDQRQALAGIVHALLITKHMFFVGFGLDDDHFHRIVDDVRKAMRPAGSSGEPEFGTALLPSAKTLKRELWARDLQCEPTGPADTAEAFRTQEIALDYLLARSVSSTGHLLDPDFEDLLDPEDNRLRELLQPVAVEVASGARCTPAWLGVATLLKSLGHRT